MKKKLVCAVLFTAVTGFALTGCGDGSGEVGLFIVSDEAQQAVSVTAQPVNAAPEQNDDTQGIRLLYYTGELTEEEEAAALEAMQTMLQNLGLEEYWGEGLHMISSAEWMDTFAVRLVEGSRTYYLQEDGNILLTVRAEYDINEKRNISTVYYQDPEGKVVLLEQAGSTTQVISASVSEGEYDGDFHLWQLNGESGEIRHEEGTYAAGVIVGEYTIAIKEGTAAGDVYDLWNNRENMEYVVTTQRYDDKGELIPDAAITPSPSPAPAATPKPAATSKPAATPKPTAVPKPAATPKPVTPPKPTPVPEQPDDDDDDDGGDNNGGSGDNGSGGGNNGGSGDNGSGGGNNGGSPGGADTDIEWSGDIL